MSLPSMSSENSGSALRIHGDTVYILISKWYIGADGQASSHSARFGDGLELFLTKHASRPGRQAFACGLESPAAGQNYGARHKPAYGEGCWCRSNFSVRLGPHAARLPGRSWQSLNGTCRSKQSLPDLKAGFKAKSLSGAAHTRINGPCSDLSGSCGARLPHNEADLCIHVISEHKICMLDGECEDERQTALLPRGC